MRTVFLKLIHKVPLEFDASPKAGINSDDRGRFVPIKFPIPHLSAIVGSTIAAVNGDMSVKVKAPQKDTISIGYNIDDGRVKSMVIGMGCIYPTSADAHPPSPAAVSEYLTRFLERTNFFINRPGILILPTIRHLLKQMLPQTLKATVACAEIMRNPDGTFRFYGVAIGDIVMAYWDPKNKKVVPLICAQSQEGKTHTVEKVIHDYIQLVDTTIPDGCLLISMTKGAFLNLCQKTEVQDQYFPRTEHKLLQGIIEHELCNLDPNADTYLHAKWLLNRVAWGTEKQKSEEAAQTKMSLANVGNDATVLVTRISAEAFDDAFSNWAYPELLPCADEVYAKAQANYSTYMETKETEYYDAAVELTREADRTYGELGNHLGVLRCQMLTTRISHSHYAYEYAKKQPKQAEQASMRYAYIMKLPYIIDYFIDNLSGDKLYRYNNKKKFAAEFIEFLKITRQQLTTYIAKNHYPEELVRINYQALITRIDAVTENIKAQLKMKSASEHPTLSPSPSPWQTPTSSRNSSRNPSPTRSPAGTIRGGSPDDSSCSSNSSDSAESASSSSSPASSMRSISGSFMSYFRRTPSSSPSSSPIGSPVVTPNHSPPSSPEKPKPGTSPQAQRTGAPIPCALHS